MRHEKHEDFTYIVQHASTESLLHPREKQKEARALMGVAKDPAASFVFLIYLDITSVSLRLALRWPLHLQPKGKAKLGLMSTK